MRNARNASSAFGKHRPPDFLRLVTFYSKLIGPQSSALPAAAIKSTQTELLKIEQAKAPDEMRRLVMVRE